MRDGLRESQFPFVGRVGEASRRELLTLAPAHAQPGRHLLHRGDPADGAYFVLTGSMRVFYLGAAGREATLYHVEPGATCVLALTATFNREPYPAWVDSGPAGVQFVRVPQEFFRRLFDEEPAFREFLFGVLSGRVFELMRHLEEAGTAHVEQRVARYLSRRADREGRVRVTQAGIASEIGTAREVVFRALRSLASRGLIETHRARVEVRDRCGLGRLAEDGLDSAVSEAPAPRALPPIAPRRPRLRD